MPGPSDPVLTAAQMREAEHTLIAGGTSVDALMLAAGQGAADYVWRIAAGRPVTVLCGPGNNGGDGYVIAETIRQRGGDVAVVAARDPVTSAARNACAAYGGAILSSPDERHGGVFVDCLFGTGLDRPLGVDDLGLLRGLAAAHALSIAVDLPSGVDSDSGAALNAELPAYDLTIALGAWKPAHFLMPAAFAMGALRLVPIGISAHGRAAFRVARPHLSAPAHGVHKYTRGLLGVIGGAMPGAALLAACAAQHSGAGYIKMLAGCGSHASYRVPADLVVDARALADALTDARLAALLVGPGLGRDSRAGEQLAQILSVPTAAVLDADALVLLEPGLLSGRTAPLIVTPHEGELSALERAFGLARNGSKPDRAGALAVALSAVVVAKGADTVIAAPDGHLAFASPASSWLSTAGTGDVLAGIIASRLAAGAGPFAAACDGLWLHGEAARLCGPAFTAGQLAQSVQAAYAACL
ncbi:NAD(P)H-hydrate dehydratase [Novosphingobium sp.]|uniref:NAD(P)H-hydrate dehydratase n=1 Tax=Novosphingobium sp. TaxID=1874826 RepID=UPI0025D30798|nr:NAD(P)H-hydrate dehydratase [Novosphingobium sp.]